MGKMPWSFYSLTNVPVLGTAPIWKKCVKSSPVFFCHILHIWVTKESIVTGLRLPRVFVLSVSLWATATICRTGKRDLGSVIHICSSWSNRYRRPCCFHLRKCKLRSKPCLFGLSGNLSVGYWHTQVIKYFDWMHGLDTQWGVLQFPVFKSDLMPLAGETFYVCSSFFLLLQDWKEILTGHFFLYLDATSSR